MVNSIAIKQILLVLTMIFCIPLQSKTATSQATQDITTMDILFAQFINACAKIMKREASTPNYFYDTLCNELGINHIPIQKIPTTKLAEHMGPRITRINREITFMKFNNPALAAQESKAHPFRRVGICEQQWAPVNIPNSK